MLIKGLSAKAAISGIIVALHLSTTVPAEAFDTSRIEDPAVRACAERALPSDTAQQLQKVEVVGKNGYVRESIREMYWRRSEDNDSKMLVRVLEPIDDKGVAVLIDDDSEKNLVSYMSYSPKLKRVRRVTGKSFFGSILGTDFTYEDFSYFYRVDDREQVTRVEDAVIDDHPAYVLEAVKPGDNSNYSLVRSFIDKDVCLPVRTEFLGPNGEVRKELILDREQIKQVDDHWVPYVSTMRDLKLGTHSVLHVVEVEIDPDLREGLFEISELKRGN